MFFNADNRSQKQPTELEMPQKYTTKANRYNSQRKPPERYTLENTRKTGGWRPFRTEFSNGDNHQNEEDIFLQLDLGLRYACY